MTGLLAAVTALQRLDEVGLRTLLTERALPYERIDDYFDLAEQLLSPARLNAVLPRQQRTVLELLRSGAQPAADAATTAHAISLLLLDPATGSAYPPVRDWLETHPEPSAANDAAAKTPARTDPPAASAAASRFSERGYRAITAAAELAVQLAGHAVRKRELAGIGNLSTVDARRIGEALGLESEQIGLLLALADRAGLLMIRGGSWRPDPAAEDAYRSSRPAQRWWRLFTAWNRLLVQPSLPPSCTPSAIADGAEWAEPFRRFLEEEYPLGQDWIEPLLTELLGGAELLGITIDGVLTPVGAGAISEAEGHAADEHPIDEEVPQRLHELLEQHLPKEIEHVYVQHDLSVIAPGPLRAELDARLRSIADAEGQGFASGYRINADTLARGFGRGLAESEIRRFLEQVSLTGIPQPLDYLLRELGARHGSIQVAAVTGAQAASLGYRSRLRSSDPELLDQLLVDSRLRLLQFTRADDELRSAVNASVVALTLQEARYPAVADPVPPAPAQDTTTTAPADDGRDDALIQLLQRLSHAREESPQSRQSWFTRQLQSAIRAKLPVTITVQMPDDTLAEFDLEPSAVAGGRVRGRDRRRDSEHTLPLSRVQEVVIRQD